MSDTNNRPPKNNYDVRGAKDLSDAGTSMYSGYGLNGNAGSGIDGRESISGACKSDPHKGGAKDMPKCPPDGC